MVHGVVMWSTQPPHVLGALVVFVVGLHLGRVAALAGRLDQEALTDQRLRATPTNRPEAHELPVSTLLFLSASLLLLPTSLLLLPPIFFSGPRP
jgi:hypothetical protein